MDGRRQVVPTGNLPPRGAVVGVTETVLEPAPAGLWDRGPALRVRLSDGELLSRSPDDVLNGANVAAMHKAMRRLPGAFSPPVAPKRWRLAVMGISP